MKKLIYIFVFVISTFTSCDKSNVEDGSLPDISVNTVRADDVNHSIRPVILGERKNNPFSLENMQIALDTLKKFVKQSDNGVFNAKALDEIQLQATDLYVRFLPTDSVQYQMLKKDTSLILFDFPLDYVIKQNGEYYKDPTVTTQFTWLYTTVKPGYVAPEGIKYEIIKELFIPEHSEYYSEVEISDSTGQNIPSKIGNKQMIDKNICNALYAISFTLTGNEKDLNTNITKVKPTTLNNNQPIMKMTVPNCTLYRIKVGWWYVSWTSCDPFYYPDGYVKVVTPKGEVGVKGIKVRMWRWFSYDEARTNASGHYYCPTRFNSLWVGNSIDYHLIFHAENGITSWDINYSLFGAECLWTDYYSAGSHTPDGYSFSIDTNSDAWGKCVQSNAIYDYCDIVNYEGISSPPFNLEIATLQSDNYTSSAPLFKNTLTVTSAIAYYCKLYNILPDIILRYSKDLSKYNKITYYVWHELTHSSQVTRMINEKGYLWASKYWGANCGQQAWNSINNGGEPYGTKGDANWQIIALSEGWANYREKCMEGKYLNNGFNDSTLLIYKNSKFPYCYMAMYAELHLLGCYYTDMEKFLFSYSFSEYRDNLIRYYPNLKDSITAKVNRYESKNF